MSKAHYIAMSGDHGCLPDHCDVYPTKQGAIDDLTFLFDHKRGMVKNLREYGYFDLSSEDGAEYCEVIPCNCPEPWIHQDSMTKDQFIRECGADYGLVAEDD